MPSSTTKLPARPQRGTFTPRAGVAGIIAACTVALFLAGGAIAGSCRIFMAIGEAEARPTGGQSVLDLVGVWEYDNVIQVALDLEIAVVVTQGDHFAIFPFGGPAATGTLPTLVDGENIAGADLPDIKAAAVTDPDAAMLVFTPHRIQLALPPSVTAGALNVFIYLARNGDFADAFLSNVVTTRLAGSASGV
jgi:hypothetical protein